jgi:hypothetical protein
MKMTAYALAALFLAFIIVSVRGQSTAYDSILAQKSGADQYGMKQYGNPF